MVLGMRFARLKPPITWIRFVGGGFRPDNREIGQEPKYRLSKPIRRGDL